jgi:predicted RNA-binding protein with PIN domain
MKIIVDAYNLYHLAKANVEPAGALTISAFVTIINQWAARIRSQVTLIFDGKRPTTLDARNATGEYLFVEFTGPSKTADSVIIDMANSYSAPRTLLVVSSDHEIRRAASRRGSKVVTSDAFWAVLVKILNQPPRRREPREKQTGLTSSQTDYWLDQFGLK